MLAADACAAGQLELIPLPDDLRDTLDRLLPPRWSRSNPVDLAGGETRDTIPDALERCCAHPGVDAVLLLGCGIQANQANVFRGGRFFPDFGLERITEFHERQDRRYADAAREASERHGKPVLVATELVYTDRAYGNREEFKKLSPRGSGILGFLSNIPILGALFKLIPGNTDTLNNPDSYAYYAMSLLGPGV